MLVVIPVRAGSKRIPRKWAQEVGGRSLLAWKVAQAQTTGLECVVASEDAEILAEAAQLGAPTWQRHPASAADHAPDIAWAMHLPTLYADSLFVVARITSPFLDLAVHVPRMRDTLAAGGYSSIRCARPAVEHPCKVWVREGAKWAPAYRPDSTQESCSRPTQTLPPAFVQTAGAEIIPRRTLCDGVFAGENVGLYLLDPDDPAALDINTPADLARARQMVDDGLVTT